LPVGGEGGSVAHFGSVSEEDQIAAVVRRITQSLGGTVANDLVEGQVRACFRRWADAPVRDFVPIFAERCALEELALVGSTPAGAAAGLS
jgi:hypothetical protein